MPRSKVIFARKAEHDLDGLYEWIAADSGVPRADAALLRIDRTLNLVAQMPGMGRIRHDLEHAPRSFVVWPWTILYRFNPKGDGIQVLRVLDGRRDLPGVLKRD